MLKADWLISLSEKIDQSKSRFFLYGLVCFILGVTIASFFRLPRAVLFYVYLVLLILPILAALFWQEVLKKIIFCGAIFLVLGVIRFQFSEPPVDAGNIRFYHDRIAEISGFVAEEPNYNERQTVVVQSEKLRVLSQSNDKDVGGRLVFYAPFYPQYHYGNKISLRCFLTAPLSKEDVGYPLRLARRGVWSICLDPQIISSGVGGGRGWRFLFIRLSDILTEQINKILNEPQAAFLDGLLFGSRASIPADLKNYFNRTGTTHIIAVSGFNITIIAGALLALLRGLYIPRKKAFWLAVLGVIFFVLLTGASASVVRAGIMGVVVLLARQVGRLSQVGRLLILTAFLMLLVNPRLLFFDAGFQLSFAATLGLIYISPLLERRFKKVPNFLGIRDVIITTLSAIIATAPLIIYLFGRFSLVAPLANLLILPIIPFTMYLGFVVLLAGSLFSPVGQIGGFLVWLPLTYIIKVVEYLGAFGWASITVPAIPWWIIVIIYGIMIAIVYRLSSKSKCQSSNQ